MPHEMTVKEYIERLREIQIQLVEAKNLRDKREQALALWLISSDTRMIADELRLEVKLSKRATV